MFKLLLLMAAFVFPDHKATVPGAATIYHPGDGFCGKVRADGKPFRVTDRHFAHRSLPLGTRGYLCSTVTKKCARSYVGDRGPYGALLRVKDGPSPGDVWKVKRVKRKCHWANEAGDLLSCKDFPPETEGVGGVRLIMWKRKFHWYQVQIRLGKDWPWYRRGNFDLTRPVARDIDHRAFQKVIFFYLPKIRSQS